MVPSTILLVALSMTLQDGKEPVAIDPAMLIGAWEVVKADDVPVGSIVEFTADGRYESNPKGNGRSGFVGTYKVKGDRVEIEPNGYSIAVTELTANRLVLDGSIEYRRRGVVEARAMLRSTRRSRVSSPGTMPKLAGVASWQVVRPKDGRYTVEMPGRPEGWEHFRSGDGFAIDTLVYQLNDVELLVSSSDRPTAIPEAELAKAFERLLAEAATEWGIGTGLKVVSERPDRVGPVNGRQYELTFERPPFGTIGVRGRVFADGKTTYLLMAVLEGRRKVPAALVSRFFDSFALIGPPQAAGADEPGPAKPRRPEARAWGASIKDWAYVALALSGINRSPLRIVDRAIGMLALRGRPGDAARPMLPGPKASTNPLKAWGTEIDPDGDVEVEATGDTLTIRIPGTPHVLSSEETDGFNAPRVVSPVRKEFAATVRVDGEFQPSRESTTGKLSSRQAGGLLLWKDADNYIVLQRRTIVGKDGKPVRQVIFDERRGGRRGTVLNRPSPDGPVFLRLERKEGIVSGAFSGDGREWTKFKPIDAQWSRGLADVGVVAVNTSTGPHAVKFDEYSLEAK